jgi:hypothetical protein
MLDHGLISDLQGRCSSRARGFAAFAAFRGVTAKIGDERPTRACTRVHARVGA